MKKRFVAALLSIFLIACMLPVSVAAANSAIASTLRLEAVKGTVTLQNKNGKAFSLREGIKLYDGYMLETGAASYAFISLDGTKAIKLDASSSAVVRQSGKHLEVDLLSGNLYFNVTTPVAADSTLNIRTSTTVTGIRGTSGYISIDGQFRSTITILTGRVESTVHNPLTNTSQTMQIVAGQTVVGVVYTENDSHTENEAFLQRQTGENTIPPYVAVEIAGDVDAQQKISSETTLNVKNIVENADLKLNNHETEQAVVLSQIEKDTSNLESGAAKTPLFVTKPSTQTTAPSLTKPDAGQQSPQRP